MELQTQSKELESEVLIIGAGPTGLALASSLSQSGIDTIIVDRLETGQNTSRAAVIHAHTLEMLREIGVAERLVDAGLPVAKFSLRDRDKVLVRLRFDKLPTPFSQLLMLPQDNTEKILRDRLGNLGTEVRWGWTVTDLAENGEGVVATAEVGGTPRTINARYVVGADGMHSLVRQIAGIGFSGSTYEESFVLADVDMQWCYGRDEVMLFFSPRGLVVVAPLPSGQFRIVATLDNAPEQPDIADVQALIDSRGPTDGQSKISAVHWSSRFRLHHRVADRYRRGRLLLMGDAAHVHSPAGGQGMNTGLVDAVVLGRILTSVIMGDREESYLDRYEELRRPAAKQVLKLADRLTHMATMKSTPQRVVRNTLLRILGSLPMARDQLQMNLSGLSRRAAAEMGSN
jgi:2-polyprenyl-6-methoxyphenol hydroxylase-like FAD-dependent oxidoreductase